MDSISLTIKREIARCYADIHAYHKNKNRYYRSGNPSFWLTQHYSTTYASIYTKYFFTAALRLLKWRKNVKINTVRSWSSKVNKKAKNTWQSFDMCSDIEGNFPMIIGISANVESTSLPQVFSRVETRSLSDIPLAHITYIEVPKEFISRIQQELISRNVSHIQVFDIELGEYYLYNRFKK